ncbi:Uu.00g090550.m01.CDS01 [Anthostomella pinea]|uniref:Uu.00g090550.m01.CDS01 n=1 Tax=Anthostomella pinea TaxID=933095 RepID=A0AAI8VMW6_9PEZI|nr:Uu.00g090550.m01.CDS01 [Anthostomella pinea]
MSQKACDPCSSIKQRCDGSSPCVRCNRLGIECAYDRTSSRTVTDSTRYRAITIRRVRTGCASCKKRKKKCDLQKPKCSDCRRLNLPCVLAASSPSEKDSRSSLTADVRRDCQSSECPEVRSEYPGQPPAQQVELVIRNDQGSTPQGIQPPSTHPYSWLDPDIVPGSGPDDNASNWNYEEDPMTSMASIAIDMASMEEIVLSPTRTEAVAPSSYPPALIPPRRDSVPLVLQPTFMGTPLQQLSSRDDKYLFHHYTNVVARSLCIASPQETNPFLKLILPLASLSALNRLIGEGPKSKSSNPFDTELLALAAILLFCIIDIRQGISTNWLWHITAAKNLISCRTNSTSSLGPSSDPWPFLLDLFEYVDSIITISKCKPPLIEHAKHTPDVGPRNLLLNPIFGVARPLIRFIGQISALSNRRKYRVNARFEEKFRESAAVINQNLRAWEPEPRLPSVILSIRDADLCSAIHCAYAIKYASILRLHQVVEGYKLPNPTSTECCRNILSHVQQIPIGSPAESSLVFPLFMAGAVSVEQEDRMTVGCRWAIIGRTIGFGNVAKGRIVLDMVWKAMDEDLSKARERGEEETTEANWAKIRWNHFSELVLF